MQGDRLEINPRIPRTWSGFTLGFCYNETLYNICVENPRGVSQGVHTRILDGQDIMTSFIPLVNDQQTHVIRVILDQIPHTEMGLN